MDDTSFPPSAVVLKTRPKSSHSAGVSKRSRHHIALEGALGDSFPMPGAVPTASHSRRRIHLLYSSNSQRRLAKKLPPKDFPGEIHSSTQQKPRGIAEWRKKTRHPQEPFRRNLLNQVKEENRVNPFDTLQESIYPSEMNSLLAAPSSSDTKENQFSNGIATHPPAQQDEMQTLTEEDISQEALSFWERLKEKKRVTVSQKSTQKTERRKRMHPGGRIKRPASSSSTAPRSRSSAPLYRGGKGRQQHHVQRPSSSLSMRSFRVYQRAQSPNLFNQEEVEHVREEHAPVVSNHFPKNLLLDSDETPPEDKIQSLEGNSLLKSHQQRSSGNLHASIIQRRSMHPPKKKNILHRAPSVTTQSDPISSAISLPRKGQENTQQTDQRPISAFALTGQSYKNLSTRSRKSKFEGLEDPASNNHKSLFQYLMGKSPQKMGETFEKIDAPSDAFSYDANNTNLNDNLLHIPPTIQHSSVPSPPEAKSAQRVNSPPTYDRKRVHSSLGFTKLHTPKQKKKKKRKKRKTASKTHVQHIPLPMSPALSAWQDL